MTPRRVFVLEIHKELAEMSSAELLAHLLVLYSTLLAYVKMEIGESKAEKAQNSYSLILTEIAERLDVDKAEILRHVASTMDLVQDSKGGGNAPS